MLTLKLCLCSRTNSRFVTPLITLNNPYRQLGNVEGSDYPMSLISTGVLLDLTNINKYLLVCMTNGTRSVDVTLHELWCRWTEQARLSREGRFVDHYTNAIIIIYYYSTPYSVQLVPWLYWCTQLQLYPLWTLSISLSLSDVDAV